MNGTQPVEQNLDTTYPARDDMRSNCVALECSSTSLVLRKILGYFSDRELLSVYSFVDETWNYEARSLVRDRKKIVASIRNPSPCKELLKLGRDLSGMNKVPFHGLRLKLQCCQYLRHCSRTSEEQAICFDTIIAKIPLEYFSVEFTQLEKKPASCAAIKFFVRVLNECSFQLQELSVKTDKSSAFLLSPDIIQVREFPSLKVLKFYINDDTFSTSVEDSDFKLMLRLLRQAPNLQEFHHNGSLNMLTKALHMSQAVNVSSKEFYQFWDKLPENLLCRVKFQILTIESILQEDYGLNRFYEILSLELKNSQQTLECVKMDCVMAMPLSTCCSLPLENVKNLEIDIDYHYFELVQPAVLQILRNFKFRRVFPNLKYIEFNKRRHIKLDTIRQIVGAGEIPPAEPNQASNIEQIRLRYCLKEYTIRFFAEMCPNIKKLHAIFERRTWTPYSLIWTHWKNLEELHVLNPGIFSVVPYEGEQELPKKNLDAEFCGINPEEVEELLKQDEEFLKAVHIVPIQPAITCLSGLRKFKLEVGNEGLFKFGPNSTLIFSRVTGLIAFRRMSLLSVEIMTGSSPLRQALQHLEPFAKVTAE